MARITEQRIACIAAALGAVAIAAPASAQAPSATFMIRATSTPPTQSATFTFDVSCTGDAAPIERTVSLITTNGVGASAVDGIPADMACVVIDRAPAGWHVETSNPQAVVTATEGTTVEFAHTAPGPADMSIVKTSDPAGASVTGATPPDVPRGSTIRYVLTYTNSGDQPADAVVADEIPAGTAYAAKVRCEPACTSAPTVRGNRVSFPVKVEGHASGSVSYVVRVSEDTADGDVIGSGASVLPGRARAAAVQHRVAVPAAGLRVVGAVDKDSAPAGDVVRYAIEVTNRGSAAQRDVTVTDAVPGNATYVAGSATCAAPCRALYDKVQNTVTWHVDSLGADESVVGMSFAARIRPLVVNPDGSLPGTVVLNSAVASSDNTPAIESNEVQTVVVAVLGSKTVRGRSPAAAPAEVPTLPATGRGVGPLLAAALLLLVTGVAMLTAEREWNCRISAGR